MLWKDAGEGCMVLSVIELWIATCMWLVSFDPPEDLAFSLSYWSLGYVLT